MNTSKKEATMTAKLNSLKLGSKLRGNKMNITVGDSTTAHRVVETFTLPDEDTANKVRQRLLAMGYGVTPAGPDHRNWVGNSGGWYMFHVYETCSGCTESDRKPHA